MTSGPNNSPGSSNWISSGIRSLYPGYFALVMATGIVSNALWLLDHRELSNVLFAVNLVAFPILLVFTFTRIVRFPKEIWADLTNPRKVFGFFTIVAASDVLGIQFLLRDVTEVAVVLWLTALVIWVGLSYFSFTVLALISRERGAAVVHGGWLIAIVGTESLVLLGAQLAPEFGSLTDITYLTVHALWGVGIVLYGIFVTLFSYRIFFAPIEPEEMNPLFWVVMGAAAIATNAGSTLILTSTEVSFLEAMKPFVDGTTLVLWAWSTWLIPLFVLFGIWRHIVRKYPLEYAPTFWSLVFPLGMYSVATFKLSSAADFSPMMIFSKVMVWVALIAWAITMTGLLRSLWRGARTARVTAAA